MSTVWCKIDRTSYDPLKIECRSQDRSQHKITAPTTIYDYVWQACDAADISSCGHGQDQDHLRVYLARRVIRFNALVSRDAPIGHCAWFSVPLTYGTGDNCFRTHFVESWHIEIWRLALLGFGGALTVCGDVRVRLSPPFSG
jgi:hypothetical protein